MSGGGYILDYYYNEQIRKYLIQFMSVFSGLQVNTARKNEPRSLMTVPLHYANRDRVVAHLRSGGTQNKMLKLPLLTINIDNINFDLSLRHGLNTEFREMKMPRGGIFPDDISGIKKLTPIAYKLINRVYIYASNITQLLEILEQIMLIFDPYLQIQKNDSDVDWTRQTSIELEGINLDTNFPIHDEQRILIADLEFSMKIYISAPANLKKDYIKSIHVRMGMVDAANQTTEEMMGSLDAQQIDYEKWFDLDDIKL